MKSRPAVLHYSLGIALGYLGWSEGAIQAFRDALEKEPNNADVHFQLGEVLGRAGRWGEASEAFARAALLRPSSPEPHGNLVLALARAGRLEAAAHALARLIELRPHQAELHILQGALQRKLRRPHEAIRAFRWAARHEPTPDWTRFNLGEALLGREGWQALVTAYRGAHGLQPRDPLSDCSRSWHSPLQRRLAQNTTAARRASAKPPAAERSWRRRRPA